MIQIMHHKEIYMELLPANIKEIFRYASMDGHHTIIGRNGEGHEFRYLVNEADSSWRVIPAYSFEAASHTGANDLIQLGFQHPLDVAKDLIKLFENPDLEHVDGGKGFYSTVVEYSGQTLRVTVQIRKRQVAKVTNLLFDRITRHAYDRAKERWGIDLNYDYVSLIIEQMDAGNYKLHSENPDCITVSLCVAYEDISIVYDPRAKQIVTFIPNKDPSKIF